MELRRLNEEGIRRMEAFLDSLTTESPDPYPTPILTNPATSEALGVRIAVDRRPFPRRFELAQYLHERLTGAGLREPERDAGPWAWLALFWFDQLCPARPDGRRKPGERARWIPRIDETRYSCRHLVLGPYAVYAAYSQRIDLAEPLLCQPLPMATSEVFRLFSENRRLLSCTAALSLAKLLYYDSQRRRLRSGAGRKEQGGLRRLIAFLDQLDRTYDLQLLSRDDLLDLLPREFGEFGRAIRVA